MDVWMQLAIQIPIVIAFMYFMIRWQSSQHEANERNHKMWQSWLDRMFAEQREERDEWRAWLRERDARWIAALTRLEAHITTLTNMFLLFFSGDEEKRNQVLEMIQEDLKRRDKS